MGTRLLIIGGVAGGATAAARARRIDEHADIILFERGEFISFANCGLPYYIGDVIKAKESLMVTTPAAVKARYRIDIRTFAEVIGIDRQRKEISVRNHRTGETYREGYTRLILAPGAEPIRPPLAGMDLENVFTLRTIPDAERIKLYLDTRKPQSATVIGGGFIGLEMAENLTRRGIATTVLELLDQVLPPLDYEMASPLHAHLTAKGVRLELENGLAGIARRGERLLVETQKGNPIECDMVLLSIGVRPETKLAREAGLTIGPLGGIQVDAGMHTSDPDILAVGDAVEVTNYISGQHTITQLAGPANRQARIAADNALGRSETFRGTLGTAIVRVFEMVAAITGLSEKVLRKHSLPYQVSYTHSPSHASYYPGAATLSIKLIFQPGTGRILGAQIIGGEGVDKRIDVLATAICGGMTVRDLEDLELAYAPPFGSAKDPVNIAGYAASNLLKGDTENIYPPQLAAIHPAEQVLIDLRNKEELDAAGRITGALHIPLPELRSAIAGLDRQKTYLPFCAAGLRGYIGHRILTQNGLRSRNLSGGFKTYSSSKEKSRQ